jgi:hypothetical protein
MSLTPGISNLKANLLRGMGREMALCAHRGVTQCRTYFKTGQPRHSPFDPGCVKTYAAQKSLESYSNTPPNHPRLDT